MFCLKKKPAYCWLRKPPSFESKAWRRPQILPPNPCHLAVVISVPVHLGCKHFCALAYILPGVQTLLPGELRLQSYIHDTCCAQHSQWCSLSLPHACLPSLLGTVLPITGFSFSSCNRFHLSTQAQFGKHFCAW